MTDRKLKTLAESLDVGDQVEDPALPFKDKPHYLARTQAVGLIEGAGSDRTPGWILLEFSREQVKKFDKYDPQLIRDRLVVLATRVMTLVQ